MKIALCFIISNEHILNKEHIWREWIEYNKDIINIYFYYQDIKKIKSDWILHHIIPAKYIFQTSYYHIIPAYTSLMSYALNHDSNNQWFCFLTDSCCPIISPINFRNLFYNYYNKSIISWKPSWWNIQFHKRANLALIPEKYHLGNDPWFLLKRENINHYLTFIQTNNKMAQIICNGGLANESLFAIVLQAFGELDKVISAASHITDWMRMSSTTSPHLFKEGNEIDIKFIEDNLQKNKYAMFIRKIASEFPDKILKYYLYEYNREKEKITNEPFIFKYNRIKNVIIFLNNCFSLYYSCFIAFLIYLYLYE